MKTVKYQLGHPLNELKQLSAQLGGEIKLNKWSYDNDLVKGYMEFYELAEGLFLYAYETHAQQKIKVTRLPSLDETYFIINLDISGIDITVHSGIPINKYGSAAFDGIFMASSQIKASFVWPTTKQIGVKIVIHKEWIARHFDIRNDNEKLLINYLLEQHNPVYLFEYMDSKSLSVVKDIFHAKSSPGFLSIKLLYCTLQLVEIFFSRIANREQSSYQKFHHSDLDRIFTAQQKMILDFSKPCPSIDELSAIANMSQSKFQKLFRQVFGQSVYQYFQTSRMRQALHLLETGKLNVAEVAMQVGYLHAGKFSEAFFKQFGFHPNESKKQLALLNAS
jgi:AraC-like DNA-binding protein